MSVGSQMWSDQSYCGSGTFRADIDLAPEKVVYQTGGMMNDAVLSEFTAGSRYLNTASVGIPPTAAANALRVCVDDWESGRVDPVSFDRVVDRARELFGSLVGTATDSVAVVNQASLVSGLVASSLPDGAHVLCAEGDFTSVLYPFLIDQRLKVSIVPLNQLIAEITDDVDLVAVSAVQSADGRLLDLDAFTQAASAAGALTYLDVTQAAGWVDLDVERFDVTSCGAYKWLCSPRGVGFMTVGSNADWLLPRLAGWYSAEEPWKSVYGAPLRLAADARRYNVSPPWFDIAAAVESLEFLHRTGVDEVNRHSVGLANRFREGMGLPPSNSAIVAVETENGQALKDAGFVAAVRAGKVRVSFYVYNTTDDADTAAALLMP